MNNSSIAIRTEQLSKVYSSDSQHKVEALKSLDLSVQTGEIFGLLGPNGAGKTTLVKTLLGILRPTSGKAFIFNEPAGCTAAKNLLGFLPENHKYPLFLKGQQVLEIYGNLAGVSGKKLKYRITELLELVSLEKWRNTPVKKYSKGMMQRLGLAQALLASPQVLFLDEPTDGIDPVGRREIRDILFQVRDQGVTIFLNSHLLSEVELLTNRVAILNKGTLLKVGSTEELTKFDNVFLISAYSWKSLDMDAVQKRFPQMCSMEVEDKSSEQLLRVDAPNEQRLNDLIDTLRQQNILITSVTQKRNSLEEMFFSIIGE